MSTLTLNPWIDANPVQRQFILSRELEAALFGPRGEGKTEAGFRRLTLHAAEQPEETRPIPWAVIRDTWENLKRTTLKSLLFPHPGSFCEKIRPLLQIKDGGKTVLFPGFWEINFFGIDSLGDLSRLQSLQLGGLWLEEPSPAAAEDIGGGLEERVVTVGITSLRHPCNWRTVQITSNYPDEDHWCWQRYAVRRTGRIFQIPRGENPYLPTDYRSNMETALANDKGLLQRLVLGMPGFVIQGESVVPEYDPLIHRSDRELDPYPNVVGYRFWDGWHFPTCIVCQVTPRGQLQIFEALAGPGMGTKQLVGEFVKPAMNERYGMVPEWVDIGDPSMATADQSDYEQSAATTIERELHTQFIPGPSSWTVRKEAIKSGFVKMLPKNHPFILLSNGKKTQELHQSLRGGWHYRLSPSGNVVGRIPVKDKHSHYGDALSHGLPELLYMSTGNMIDPYVYPDNDDVDGFFNQRSHIEEGGRDYITGY
jgi:hypothetical protein